jgi:hypothetical protein
MIAPQTPERPARDGETCSCGRPAVTVSQTEKFGDVPFCGVEGGGHSASPVAWGSDAQPHPLDGIQTGASITVRLKDGHQYAGVAQLTANGHLAVHTGNEIHDVSPLDIEAIHYGKGSITPQDPPPCPVEWCTVTDPRHNEGHHCIHNSDHFGSPTTGLRRPWIVREWTAKDGWEPPVVTIGAEHGIVNLDANTARAIAQAIESAHPGSELAIALRKAADELDRITSGGGS